MKTVNAKPDKKGDRKPNPVTMAFSAGHSYRKECKVASKPKTSIDLKELKRVFSLWEETREGIVVHGMWQDPKTELWWDASYKFLEWFESRYYPRKRNVIKNG